MSQPTISVIIPAYNQGLYIAQAIQSVLAQTFADFELIVVDDGSTDNTARIISSFVDPRLRYIYQANRGLPSARNRGMAAARGSFVCFLDSDDVYLPHKLAVQHAHLVQTPALALSYGANIEIDPEGNPLWLKAAPTRVELADLLMGFPFNINDVLIKRDWIRRAGSFDESFVMHGEDRPFYTDLALAGAPFGGVDEFLTGRRLYSGRVFKNIPTRLGLMLRALRRVLDDPRCPVAMRVLEGQAIGSLYLNWSIQSYMQSEIGLGQDYMRQALLSDPALAANDGENIRKQLIWANIRSGDDHESTIPRFMSYLPSELIWLSGWGEWCLGQGHFLLGVSHTIWNRGGAAEGHFRAANACHCRPDRAMLDRTVDDLLNLHKLRGAGACDRAMSDLAPFLDMLAGSAATRYVRGRLAFNRAMVSYGQQAHREALSRLGGAFIAQPGYVLNRGALSVAARSTYGYVRKRGND